MLLCVIAFLSSSYAYRDGREPASGAQHAHVPRFDAPQSPAWQLVWSDEFDGSSLNPDNWSNQLGDGCDLGTCGWGNGEKQVYSAEAVTVATGELTIDITPRYNHTFSSARIRTLGKVEHAFGRIEGRFHLPQGRGLWPGFWLLPSDQRHGKWSASGEIDIMVRPVSQFG